MPQLYREAKLLQPLMLALAKDHTYDFVRKIESIDVL